MKINGKHSMPVKRNSSEGVYGGVLQDPRDMVRAILPEAQVPAVQWSTPPITTPKAGPSNYHAENVGIHRTLFFQRSKVSGRWAMSNEDIQGTERATYVTLSANTTEMWDCLRGTSPMATEPP